MAEQSVRQRTKQLHQLRLVLIVQTACSQVQLTVQHVTRLSQGCHKMSSVDHLHVEAEILKVMEHSEIQYAQYLARCLKPENI